MAALAFRPAATQCSSRTKTGITHVPLDGSGPQRVYTAATEMSVQYPNENSAPQRPQ